MSSVFTIRNRGVRELEELARRLSNPLPVLREAYKVAQNETLKLIDAGFREARDPYGKRWAAPHDLQITGGIRRYKRGTVQRDGFTVGSSDRKAVYHHAPLPRPAWGGKALPTRLQIPTEAQGLPAYWRRQVAQSMRRSLRRSLR